MDDALFMGIVQRFGDRDRRLTASPRRMSCDLQPIGKRLPFDEIADDIGRAGFGADLVNGHDMGMLQGGGRPGLAEKSFRFLVGELFLARHLHGHGPPQFRVLRLPDLAETAGPQPLDELEVPDPPLARAGRRRPLHLPLARPRPRLAIGFPPIDRTIHRP